MKFGIIGLPGSGKTTTFEALNQNTTVGGQKAEDRIATIRVPDDRIDTLSQLYLPRKTIYARVEYFLPGYRGGGSNQEVNIGPTVRECDALLHVVRNHTSSGFESKSPYNDFIHVDQELILADLVVAEKRIERLELDHRRGKKMNPEEYALLKSCRENLENEIPLRRIPELAFAPLLRGFAFLSAKPTLVLFNNADDDDQEPELKDRGGTENCMVIRGKLEQELSQMPPADAADFLAEFNIAESALDRIIKRCYELIGLISFFTVGDDEVRAWTIRKGTQAVDAAEVIHSDIKRGFIRAEVVAYRDLMDAGTHLAAKKKGTVRLEGKTYMVQDGDIINFRFNV